MTVDENLLSNFIMYFNGAHFTGPGEVLQAAAAARRGDDVPAAATRRGRGSGQLHG